MGKLPVALEFSRLDETIVVAGPESVEETIRLTAEAAASSATLASQACAEMTPRTTEVHVSSGACGNPAYSVPVQDQKTAEPRSAVFQCSIAF